MPELKLVEGYTGLIDETLKSNGVVIDLTGMTVALILQKADGSPVDTTANVTVPDAVNGLVRYSPDAGDLLALETPHVARWQVTDGIGKIVFVPSDAGEVWEVQPIAAVALQDNALLTIAELKAALNIKGTEQDVALADFVNVCSDAMETFTGRRLVSRTYTDLYAYVDRVLGTGWLDVEWPITALTGLTVGATIQTVWMPGDLGIPTDFDAFVLDGPDPKHARDRIYRPGGWTPGGMVKLTYTAGYGVPGFPIPGDLKQAVKSLAGDWYYYRTRQAEPVISRSAGAETVTYVNEALPRRFAALLNSYRRWS
jgi:uncharacterized phiE125 gp8 family phage protein